MHTGTRTSRWNTLSVEAKTNLLNFHTLASILSLALSILLIWSGEALNANFGNELAQFAGTFLFLTGWLYTVVNIVVIIVLQSLVLRINRES